jgi:Arginase/agmatinase/formimionoglutamate hydrolase, arginase family
MLIAETIAQLKADNVDEVYVSFDIDALDAEFDFATGTPEDNGLTHKHALDILSAIADEFPITGADYDGNSTIYR